MNLAIRARPALWVAAALATAVFGARTAAASSTVVVVPSGQPVQIAFANDLSGVAAEFGPSLSNAVRMAIGFQPTVRGFPVQLNTYDAPCGDPAADVATATAIVANGQNTGVIGQVCSLGFDQALPVYEAGGIVTITGSATDPALATHGFSVFDRLDVADPGFDAWYATVGTLPSDLAWQHGYEVIFGSPPMMFADIYYDVASLLIADLRRVSRIDRTTGSLLVDRAALAAAVRATRSFPGVTCTVRLDRANGNRIDDPAALSRCARAFDDGGGPLLRNVR
jgi:hypothetical protein